MSSLRRVVVVGKAPRIHNLAQEVAREVFAADDLTEAAEIVSTITPDLILFDGTVAPAPLRAHLEHLAPGLPDGGASVVALTEDSPFSEAEYRQAGVSDCLVGEQNFGRLRDIAAGIAAARQPRTQTQSGQDAYFLDETAAAVALARISHRVVNLVA